MEYPAMLFGYAKNSNAKNSNRRSFAPLNMTVEG
jgi:hypothetical protein